MLKIKYKNLDLTVPDAPITWVTGPARSGKSNLLEAVAFLGKTPIGGLSEAFCVFGDFGTCANNGEIILGVDLGLEGNFGFELRAKKGGRDTDYTVIREHAGLGGDSYSREGMNFFVRGALATTPRRPENERELIFTEVGIALGPYMLHDRIRSMVKYDINPERGSWTQERFLGLLQPDGSNSLSLLEKPAGDFQLGMEKYVEDTFKVKVYGGTYKTSSYEIGGKEFHPQNVGSGVMKAMGVLLACTQTNPPAMMGFDSPENGIHPDKQPILFDYIRQASERSRVLVATTSEVFLDLAGKYRDPIITLG